MGNSPSTPSPFDSVPTEILDRICEKLGEPDGWNDQTRGLKALSQTSTKFSPSSQRQLFRKIELSAVEQRITDEEHIICLQKTLEQSPTIKRYTREVNITFDITKQALLEKVHRIIKGMSNVETLDVNGWNKPCWTEFLPQIGTALHEMVLLPSLKELSLSTIYHIPADVFKTMMRISIVKLSGVSFDIPEATSTEGWDVKTQQLEVSGFSFEGDEESIDNFLSQITDNRIKSVVISPFWSGKIGNVKSINKLLSYCSELAAIDCILGEDDEGLEIIDIQSLKALTSVNLHILSSSDNMDGWGSSPYPLYPLECLLPETKHDIEEINIRFSISSYNLWNQPVERWETVDSLLSGTRYPRLKWIQFNVRDCDEGLSHVDTVYDQIASLLPKLDKKQLVRVEKAS